MRRVYLRGHTNIRKRLLIHTAGFNLGLLIRRLIGVGTPRGLQGRLIVIATLWSLLRSRCGVVIGHGRLRHRISRIERPSIGNSVIIQIGAREMAFTTLVWTPPAPRRLRC
jgi:hypothetical protein